MKIIGGGFCNYENQDRLIGQGEDFELFVFPAEKAYLVMGPVEENLRGKYGPGTSVTQAERDRLRHSSMECWNLG